MVLHHHLCYPKNVAQGSNYNEYIQASYYGPANYIVFELVGTLSKETGLSISIDYHYKFLVLLPLEADEKIEALKHYFGITLTSW
jgi:hypothetical protein